MLLLDFSATFVFAIYVYSATPSETMAREILNFYLLLYNASHILTCAVFQLQLNTLISFTHLFPHFSASGCSHWSNALEISVTVGKALAAWFLGHTGILKGHFKITFTFWTDVKKLPFILVLVSLHNLLTIQDLKYVLCAALHTHLTTTLITCLGLLWMTEVLKKLCSPTSW